MSAQCPKCKTVVTHSFGVTSCTNPKCGAMLFVDIGLVRLLGKDVPAAEKKENTGKSSAPRMTESTGKTTTHGSDSESVPMILVHSHLDTASAVKEETFPHGYPVAHAEATDETADEAAPEPNAVDGVLSDDDSPAKIPAGPLGYDSGLVYEPEAILTEDVSKDVEVFAPVIDDDPPIKTWMTSETTAEETVIGSGRSKPPAEFLAEDEHESVEAQAEDRFLSPEEFAAQSHDEEVVDFEDVVDYANHLELDNSPLVYTLWIDGVDHKDILQRVESVLADPRLNIYTKELVLQKRKQGSGYFELKNLSPIKASFIASKLREEAVSFHWQQEVLRSSEDHDVDPAADSAAEAELKDSESGGAA